MPNNNLNYQSMQGLYGNNFLSTPPFASNYNSTPSTLMNYHQFKQPMNFSSPPVFTPQKNSFNNGGWGANEWLSATGLGLGAIGTIAGIISKDTNAYEDRKIAKQLADENKKLRDKREKERDDFVKAEETIWSRL